MGEGEHDVPDPPQDPVHSSAPVTGEQAERDTYERRDPDHEQGAEQARPGAVDETREDVAARRVRPEQMLGAGRRERIAEIDGVRIVGREQRREDRDEHEETDHDPAGDRGRGGVERRDPAAPVEGRCFLGRRGHQAVFCRSRTRGSMTA